MSKPFPKQTINLFRIKVLYTRRFKFKVYAQLMAGCRDLIYILIYIIRLILKDYVWFM